MAVYVKNGTPVETQTKCASCSSSHIVRGYRESEEMVFCNFACELVRIPFKVRECSSYQDKSKPDWEQMEKLAIDIQPVSFAKPAGFRGDRASISEEVEDDCAVAETN